MDTQDIRIRSVPVSVARRLKSVLAARGLTLAEWFMVASADYVDKANEPAKRVAK